MERDILRHPERADARGHQAQQRCISEPVQGTPQQYPHGVKEQSRKSDPAAASIAAIQLDRQLKKIEPSIKELNDLLSSPGENKTLTFNRWCVKQAEALYEDIGSKPYAVPDHFTGHRRTSDHHQIGTNAKKFKKTDVPDSQFRGDTGQRTVGRNFRLLNVEMVGTGKTMFIISQLNNDDLLRVLRIPKECCKKNAQKRILLQKLNRFANRYPKVFANPPPFLNISFDQLDGRGELDLMVLHPDKGVVFLQIKSVMNEKDQQAAAKKEKNAVPFDPRKIFAKIQETENQLKRDIDIFKALMDRSRPASSRSSQDQGQNRSFYELPDLQTILVIALPSLTRQDLDDAGVELKEGINYLLKEDLFEDDVRVAEAETDLSNFRRWWDKLPSIPKPMELDIMKEIVGKYIGPLTTALTCPEGYKRECLQHFQDCVHFEGHLMKRPILNKRQIEVFEITADARRVYLSGPPGSGKTLLLVLKGRATLVAPGKHVIVLNMYRGDPGRAIGKRIFDDVSSDFKGRVHLVPEDVAREIFCKKQFVNEVMRLCAENSMKLEDLLFLVDEIYKEEYWTDILDTFKNEFSSCIVWCAGLFSDKPDCFEEHPLYEVLRCPPSVQNVLYQVDWKDERKARYVRDTKQSEVPTNGPIPLSIRHDKHAPRVSVTECRQCAVELASILKEKGLVQPAEDACVYPEVACWDFFDEICSKTKVAILVNLPRKLYEKGEIYIDTSHTRYKKYMEYIAGCLFIKTLKDEGINVGVKVDLACKDLADDQQEACIATWLYNFQGLEIPVVVFLPGDTPRVDLEQEVGRDIPAPGLRSADFEGDSDFVLPIVREENIPTLSPSSDTDARLDVHTETEKLPGQSSKTSSACKKGPLQTTDDPKASCQEDCCNIADSNSTSANSSATENEAAESGRDCSQKVPAGGSRECVGTASLHWRSCDIARYSPWDKTNIMVSGSRSLSQLILIVP